jgi:hypothetical protein
MSRRADIGCLYQLLDRLRERLGGYRYLGECNGHMEWPQRGVYFFFETCEYREIGRDLRVVRVGTHALTAGSSTTLWQRLSQHRGQIGGSHAGGGNHRGSVFRRHVGTARLNRSDYPDALRATWGHGSTAPRSTLDIEHLLEQDVSRFVRGMPFLWLDVPDAPGGMSDRGEIEENAIAMLSNRGKKPVDPPSSEWLGRYADQAKVRESGLWNVQHVDATYEPRFLITLSRYIGARDD